MVHNLPTKNNVERILYFITHRITHLFHSLQPITSVDFKTRLIPLSRALLVHYGHVTHSVAAGTQKAFMLILLNVERFELNLAFLRDQYEGIFVCGPGDHQNKFSFYFLFFVSRIWVVENCKPCPFARKVGRLCSISRGELQAVVISKLMLCYRFTAMILMKFKYNSFRRWQSS